MVSRYRGKPTRNKAAVMNIVFIVPTGVGAEIGGHSGDATPAAKLIASLCDKLIIHPNVVNASDINEMTENMLYVEGSMLDRFLEGAIGLEEVYQNKILVAVSGEITPDIVNAVSGARATIGADIEIVQLRTPIKMTASLSEGVATGLVLGWDEAVRQVEDGNFDVLVVHSPITTSDEDVLGYLTAEGGVNIWGGVEAKLSRLMSDKLGRPVIHAPVENSEVMKEFKKIVDPRKAAEMLSTCYMHCCLKGAHRAPRATTNTWVDALWSKDINFMITPTGVFGRPHRACLAAGIPVITVEENRTQGGQDSHPDFIVAKNYLEVAGVISARKAGVQVESVIRPLNRTAIHEAPHET